MNLHTALIGCAAAAVAAATSASACTGASVGRKVSEDGSVARVDGAERGDGSVHWGVNIPCVIFGAIVFLGLAWLVGRRWSR